MLKGKLGLTQNSGVFAFKSWGIFSLITFSWVLLPVTQIFYVFKATYATNSFWNFYFGFYIAFFCNIFIFIWKKLRNWFYIVISKDEDKENTLQWLEQNRVRYLDATDFNFEETLSNVELIFWEFFFRLDQSKKELKEFVWRWMWRVEEESFVDLEGNILYKPETPFFFPLWLRWRSRVSRIVKPIEWFRFIESYRTINLKLLICNATTFTFLRGAKYVRESLGNKPTFNLIKMV